MATLYIEAYTRDNRIILDYLYDQGTLDSIDYKESDKYKALSTYPTLGNKVYKYKIVNETGTLIEVVYNKTYKDKEAK